MTLMYITIFVLLGASLTTSVLAVFILLKGVNGFKIDVNLQQPKPPDENIADLTVLQDAINKAGEQHEDNVASMDALIQSLNEMMTGGEGNG